VTTEITTGDQAETLPQSLTHDLQTVLVELSRWGRVSVFQMTNGDWVCKVEATVTPIGARFEVLSEFAGHKTPLAAVMLCRARLLAAIKAIRVAP